MKRFAVVMLVAILLVVLSPTHHPSHAQSDPLTVVATYSILGDVVQNIGADKINLTILVGPDGDTHSYEPVPQDAVTLSEADLLFENGLGFETWLDDVYAASGSTATRVVISQGIVPGTITVGEDTGETDPHIWQNPYNYVRVVEIVRDTLAAADPANTFTYDLNANSYLSQLLEADTLVMQQVQTLDPDQRKLVTNHDAFGYFASRYGFEVVGTALDSVSTEAADPSAKDIADLVEAIQQTGVHAIFPENVENPDLIEQVADEAGVEVGPGLCSDALSPADGPCPTYLELIRYNATSIVEALN